MASHVSVRMRGGARPSRRRGVARRAVARAKARSLRAPVGGAPVEAPVHLRSRRVERGWWAAAGPGARERSWYNRARRRGGQECVAREGRAATVRARARGWEGGASRCIIQVVVWCAFLPSRAITYRAGVGREVARRGRRRRHRRRRQHVGRQPQLRARVRPRARDDVAHRDPLAPPRARGALGGGHASKTPRPPGHDPLHWRPDRRDDPPRAHSA